VSELPAAAGAGRSWGKELVLRDDGGGRDLGYLRSVQRSDGKVVTIYYFWDLGPRASHCPAITFWKNLGNRLISR
jgi:hypothetical protein